MQNRLYRLSVLHLDTSLAMLGIRLQVRIKKKEATSLFRETSAQKVEYSENLHLALNSCWLEQKISVWGALSLKNKKIKTLPKKSSHTHCQCFPKVSNWFVGAVGLLYFDFTCSTFLHRFAICFLATPPAVLSSRLNKYIRFFIVINRSQLSPFLCLV